MKLQEYRNQFPILEEKVHLGNCSQAPQSVAVMNAMQEYLDNWRTVGMDWSFWMEGVERAKASFARLIHADISEIGVVNSVSDATSMIASTLPHDEKNHVITTVGEFPTVGHVWHAHQHRNRIALDFVNSDDGFYTPALFESVMRPTTALLSVHHVAYYNGAKQNLKELAKFAHAHDSLLFVDAYQSMGTCDINVKELDIDILVTGNLKYLLGIPGIAFIYVRKSVAEQLEPTMTGWFARVNPFYFDSTHFDYGEGARRFNTGTPPVLAAFAARGGMDLIYEVGLKRIEQRIDELSAHTVAGVKARGLNLASPETIPHKGASTAIRVSDSHDVETFLMRKNIIASARGDVIRLAPHFYSKEADIDSALDAVLEWTKL
ncbi:aminotransferase class V-fold PLP-dependent enzyme [Alicyclobacillus sp. SO9]|uniref:aminotransferase class V-fold PLP-dependent enzyme n=1 Tax=Alicyclobacillus sp. SO9 TaxID=2665646 RepID=UPI0018E6FE9B|nr:aminotransferase class V-fold PLP-dependent enzyme [Alicyclobacillus sp. SO9]QQE80511.1 aminotransferase class V-fold PLP-dependent enzyme [Alicyclobacillus sp. SO9]